MGGPSKGINSSGQPIGQPSLQPAQSGSSNVGSLRPGPSSLAASARASPLRTLVSNLPISSNSFFSTPPTKSLAVNYSNLNNRFRPYQRLGKENAASTNSSHLNRESNSIYPSSPHPQSGPRNIAFGNTRRSAIKSMPKRGGRSANATSANSYANVESSNNRYVYEYPSNSANAPSWSLASHDVAAPEVAETSTPSLGKLLGRYPKLASTANEIEKELFNLGNKSTDLQGRIRSNQLKGIDKDIEASIQQAKALTLKVNNLQNTLSKHPEPGLAGKFDKLHEELSAYTSFLESMQKEANFIERKTKAERAEFAEKLGGFALNIARAFASLLSQIGDAIRSAAGR